MQSSLSPQTQVEGQASIIREELESSSYGMLVPQYFEQYSRSGKGDCQICWLSWQDWRWGTESRKAK